MKWAKVSLCKRKIFFKKNKKSLGKICSYIFSSDKEFLFRIKEDMATAVIVLVDMAPMDTTVTGIS